MELFLVDAIGPFFRGYERRTINWSKIPFRHLESDGRLDPRRRDQVRTEFLRFVDAVAEIGFNAITLDDAAHLIDHPGYPRPLRLLIEDYRAFFGDLFAAAAERGLQVFLTTDIMFYNESLRRTLGRSHRRILGFLTEGLGGLFRDFPALSGVIFRIGESDGKDVHDHFTSKLVVRSPAQARRYLKALLPVFEEAGKTLIFRTWSVGAYRVGDLIWNRDTFRAVFDGLESPNLVISIKHGETDFFRYLPLNKQFRRTAHRKIVEVQARREYEGCGEYPAFVGREYTALRDALRRTDHVVGIQVWCQTGGWTRFRRLTFLDPDALWNEVNTYTVLKLFKDGMPSDEAVRSFFAWRFGQGPWESFYDLLRDSEEVVRTLLYVDDFARRKLFFRRLRVPTLLSAYWDHLIINRSVRQILRCFVEDGEAKIAQGEQALETLRGMAATARAHGWQGEDLDFQYATFKLLATAREYYFRPFTLAIASRLYNQRDGYRACYPGRRYAVHLDFGRVRFRKSLIRLFLALCIREQRGYRMVDRFFTLRALSLGYRALSLLPVRLLPSFARRSAMGIETVLK